jgi:hypothetical protein
MDRIEKALAEAEASQRGRRGALIAALAAFSTAVFAGSFFLSKSAAPRSRPLEAASPPPPPPGEPSTIVIDDSPGHALPILRLGETEPALPTRSLGRLSPRTGRVEEPKRSPVRLGTAVSRPPDPAGFKGGIRAPAPKPRLESRLGQSKPSGGFASGGSAGASGAAKTEPEAAQENPAVAAARDPRGYDRKEREAAMRAMRAVLLGKDGRMQAVEWNKEEVYAAEEAVQSMLQHSHSNFKKKKAAPAGSVKIGKDGKPLNLPEDMQKQLESLGKRYKKKFDKR